MADEIADQRIARAERGIAVEVAIPVTEDLGDQSR